MSTVNLKITSAGRLSLQHPQAAPGLENLTYSITGVPADVAPREVMAQVRKICLAHPGTDERSNWVYDWSEVAGKAQGAIVNRYRQTTA